MRLPSLQRLRIQAAWTRLYRSLRMEHWFPHIPLALAVGLAGIAELIPSLKSLRRLNFFVHMSAQDLSSLSQGFGSLAIHGLSQGIIGGLLVLLGVGLLWRSRLAWVLTFLMTAITLALQLVSPDGIHSGLLIYSGTLLVVLYLARRQFVRVSLATGTLFALVGVLLTMGYGVFGSYAIGGQFDPPIRDFGSAIYFTVETMSTVGYGDITPHTGHARMFTVSLIVMGLMVFASSLTMIAGPLFNQRMMRLLQPGQRPMKRKNHVIVVGDNPLARNAISALSQRGITVTTVLKSRPPEGVDTPADLVVGDGGDADVLRDAGVADARAVLALGENDSDNAFVVLAARDANPDVRTVLAVSDAHNMGRVRHVRPDVVLALPLLGGELLAMALSGEELKADALLEQLLKLG
ncbi:hypothetical protein HF690_01410 [Oleiagrimonas citrea]|uniref:RCK N-terminal domain-containing protein n=2 Tax=Oleiagrimonas citrea TaxID=1665687 RepID=A0A846ZJ77_9GAMM|nr:hypothetical protein [Oleiagrimonas citrea]